MKQTCIFVLGMHRSGTSALTGMLSMLDVYLADTTQADNNNKKGYYENTKIQELNDVLLASIDSSWDDVFFNTDDLDSLNGDLNPLKNIIKDDFKYSKVFAIKDPRVCFLFPVWEKALKEMNVNIKIIIPYRNPFEVANSLRKRDGLSIEKGMLLWMYHFLLAEFFSRQYERVFISFDDLINNTSIVIDEIYNNLEIDLKYLYSKNKDKVTEFLEPDLKNHNVSIENLSKNTPGIIKSILDLKKELNSSDLSKEFDVLRHELFNYQSFFYNKDVMSILDQAKIDNQELEELINKLSSKESEIISVTNQLVEKESEIISITAQLVEKDIMLNIYEDKNSTQICDLELNKKALDTIEGEFKMLRSEFVDMYTSNSWKITRPIRKFMRILKS